MPATADSASRNANRALAVVRGLDESRMLAAVVVLVAVGIVALNLYAPAQPTFSQRALASLLIAMCAVPSLMWVAKRQWPHSAMPYVGVLYAACFALPIFLKLSLVGAWLGTPKLDDAAVEGALVLAIAGWAALMIGHFVVPLGALPSEGQAPRAPRLKALPSEGQAPRAPRMKALSSEGQAPRAPRLKALRRIEIVPSGPRFAKALAAVAALVGAPCLYLDNTAVVARYTGETLLPDEVAFPVAFLGQLVVFAALVLFHLQMRSQLGVAGRMCLAVLALYYTVLGFSTGMANHGLKAVVGLFVAYAVVAHRPSWRFVVLAALVGAFLILVQLPSRYDYRRLLWTHGVEPAGVPPGLGHQLEPQGESWPAIAIETPAYSVMLSGPLQPEELVFAHKEPGVCRRVRPTPDFHAFVHVYPVDLDDLAYLRRPYGFDQAGFTFKGGSVEGDRCVHRVPLPDYAIRAVRVGLFRIAVPASRPSYLPGRMELASNGEWRLLTRDEATWRIDPSAGRNRLIVAIEDKEQRRRMAMTGANNRILIKIDERNWAEYVVSEVDFSNPSVEQGWRATYGLAEMRRSEGDRTALTEGAAATLRYEQAGPIVGALSYVSSQGEGTNPSAPSASRSLAGNTVVYLQSLGYGLGDDAVKRHRWTVDRFDRLLPVAWVMANTPARIPHLRGETLRPLLHKLAPRAVYEGKLGDAQYVGWRYGFVLAAERTRNFKVHQLGEFYANFGGVGTIAGMLVLGLLYRVIHHLFHHRGASAATMAAGTHMLTVLMLEMESILSVSLGFVMWYAVVLAALAVVVRVGRQSLGSSRAGG